MADVFISYSKGERALTEQLAEYLEAQGFTVWWDANLAAGETFRDVIDRELTAAKAAIVIWTRVSVSSRWVISEADHADSDEKLIPVRSRDLDPRSIPKPFNTLHTAFVDDRAALLVALARIGVRPTQRAPKALSQRVARNARFAWASRASKGKRDAQEDAAFILAEPEEQARAAPGHHGNSESLVAVLADGTGRKGSGALASTTASTVFVRMYLASGGEVTDRLDGALETANEAVGQCVEKNPSLQDMASTLIAVVLSSAGVEWVSVGNSPLYLLRQGEIVTINEDHSLAPEIDKLAAAGHLSWEDAKNDPRRHTLRSALTGADMELIDRSRRPLPLENDDVVILASDGIHTLGEADIMRLVQENAARGCEAIADGLLAAVEAAGDIYQDNTTVVVIRVTEAVAAPQ